MEKRLDYGCVAPRAPHALYAVERYVREETHLERELIELVKLRASQNPLAIGFRADVGSCQTAALATVDSSS